MKKIILGTILFVALFLVKPTLADYSPTDLSRGNGWPHYVDVVVSWKGDETVAGSWDVYAINKPDYDFGDHVTGCDAGGPPDSCLSMSYDFVFKGKTLQFDETYVSGVEAYPQTHHVVLHEKEPGVYTGSIEARYDFPSEIGQYIRMDVIDYTVKANDNVVTDFYYVEHEFKKPVTE